MQSKPFTVRHDRASLRQPIRLLVVGMMFLQPYAQAATPGPSGMPAGLQNKIDQLVAAGVFSTPTTTNMPALDSSLTRQQMAELAGLLVNSSSPVQSGAAGGDDFTSLVTLLQNKKEGDFDQNDLNQTLTQYQAIATAYQKEVQNSLGTVSGSVTNNIQAGQTVAPLVLVTGNINALPVANPAAMAGVPVGTLASSVGSISFINIAAIQVATSNNETGINQLVNQSVGTNFIDYSLNNTLTPQANWPANLNATYNGRINGTLSDTSTIGGSITMNVNFANINSGTPNIPGSIQFDNSKGSASFNLAQLGGYVGNSMTGTYNGEAMTGHIKNGQFYGPSAQAVVGQWDMQTISVTGSGKFSANR